MPRIALLGDKDTIMGFRALGLTTFEVTGEAEAVGAISQIMREDFAVVLITERVYTLVEQTLREYRDRVLPVFTLIPDNQGRLGLGQKRLSKMVERAIGVDILFKEVGKN